MQDINVNDIRLIALDIDGTLVNDQKQFPHDFGLTMDALLKKNIKIIIASGRSLMALKRDFKDYVDRFVLMAENGGIVVDRGSTIVQHHLDRSCIHQVIDALKPLSIPSVMSGLDHGYVMDSDDPQFFDHIRVYYDAIKLDSLDELNDDVFKVSAFAWRDSRNTIYEPLKYLGATMDVVVAGDQWVDFNPKGVSKGNTLKEIMAYYGLTKDQCMAFGDQDNDLTMIESVSHGFAMKNATDNLKAKAAYITDKTNNENGCVCTIRKLFSI